MSVGIHAGVIIYHKWFLYKKFELSFIDHQFELFGPLYALAKIAVFEYRHWQLVKVRRGRYGTVHANVVKWVSRLLKQIMGACK